MAFVVCLNTGVAYTLSKGCTGGQRNEFTDQMSACVHSNDMWFGLVVTSDQV